MKLSLFAAPATTESGNPYEKFCDICLSAGITGIEGWPSEALDSVEKAKELRRILDAHGMVCPCFSTCVDLLSDHWQADTEELRRYGEMAAILGAPYLHHTLVPDLTPRTYTDAEWEEALAILVPRAKAIRETARKQGVDVIYEEQGFLVNGVGRLSRFLEALAPEEAHVCMDFGNSFFMDEAPEQLLAAVLPRIRHVHVKDYRVVDTPEPLCTLNGTNLRDADCGKGIVNWPKCLSILRKGGYDGWYSMELFSTDPEILRRNADAIRRLETEIIA